MHLLRYFQRCKLPLFKSVNHLYCVQYISNIYWPMWITLYTQSTSYIFSKSFFITNRSLESLYLNCRFSDNWLCEDAQWPKEDGSFPFKEFLHEYYDVLHETAMHILRLVAIGNILEFPNHSNEHSDSNVAIK